MILPFAAKSRAEPRLLLKIYIYTKKIVSTLYTDYLCYLAIWLFAVMLFGKCNPYQDYR